GCGSPATPNKTAAGDETEPPTGAGGWLPLPGKSGHARAVDRVAASGAKRSPRRDACFRREAAARRLDERALLHAGAGDRQA
ncbi:MAG: hypothetical protein ACXVHQ_35225, partial [Solirubrobacteraceae bacterium]